MTTSTPANDSAANAPAANAPAAAPERGASPRRKGRLVSNAVTSAIRRIMSDADSSRSRAALARLRQGIGRPPGSVPETWEYVIELPDELSTYPSSDPAARGSGASQAEVAVHAALGLWALHQQSKPGEMHRRGVSFGGAVRRLEIARGGGEASPVLRRFTTLVRARSVAGVLVHARGLVSQMRDADVAFDYGEFAADLYDLQDARSANRVRLAWGRAFQNTVADTFDGTPTTPDASTDAPNEEN